MSYREPEMEQFKKIWLTQEVYDFLRDEKIKQKKSMQKILNDIVLKNIKKPIGNKLKKKWNKKINIKAI